MMIRIPNFYSGLYICWHFIVNNIFEITPMDHISQKMLIIFWLIVVDIVMACSPENGQPKQYVPIKELVSRDIFLPSPSDTKGMKFLCRSGTMVFEADSRKLIFNGLLVWLNAPLTCVENEWALVQADIVNIVYPLAMPDVILNFVAEQLIFLDPGHGGTDGGAVGKKLVEKDVVLDIAKIVKQKLTAYNIDTIISREEDKTVSLLERVQMASKKSATAFVSIHLNSSSNSDASGIETFVLTTAGFQSTNGGNSRTVNQHGSIYDQFNIVLAYCIHSNLVKNLDMFDRGIKRAGFEVLHGVNCPAVLLECGFVSNQGDEEKLADSQFRTNLAEYITAGIIQFIRYGDSGFSFVTDKHVISETIELP